MDERLVQCEFFVPIVRNSDKKPTPTIGVDGSWRRNSPCVPGEYEDAPQKPPIKDESRRYLLAIPETKVDELRQLLRKAANTFDQKAMYLVVKGYVEFVTGTEADGYLG